MRRWWWPPQSGRSLRRRTCPAPPTRTSPARPPPPPAQPSNSPATALSKKIFSNIFNCLIPKALSHHRAQVRSCLQVIERVTKVPQTPLGYHPHPLPPSMRYIYTDSLLIHFMFWEFLNFKIQNPRMKIVVREKMICCRNFPRWGLSMLYWNVLHFLLEFSLKQNEIAF